MICWVVSGWRRTGRAPLLPWRFAPVPVSRRRKEACSRKSRSMYASSRAMSAQYHLEDVGLVDQRHATFLDESEEAGRTVQVIDGAARAGREHVAEEPAQDGAASKPDVHLVLHRKVDLVALPGRLVGANHRDRVLGQEGDAVAFAIYAGNEVCRGLEQVADALLAPVAACLLGEKDGDLAHAPVGERHFDLGTPLGNAKGIHGYLIGAAGRGLSAVHSLGSCG